MWIFNNYLSLKHEQTRKQVLENSKNNTDEIMEVECEEELSKTVKKYELDYDRTLYTVLFNLQQRQDPRDL